MDESARRLLDADAKANLAALCEPLAALSDWTEETLEQAVRSFAEARGLKLGKVAQPLRAALTGSSASPGLFEVMAILGRDETLARIADAAIAEPASA